MVLQHSVWWKTRQSSASKAFDLEDLSVFTRKESNNAWLSCSTLLVEKQIIRTYRTRVWEWENDGIEIKGVSAPSGLAIKTGKQQNIQRTNIHTKRCI
jgi:hypothetical protein